ncbi:heme oxygenase 2-like [Nematolebias whitei]|uniref:heme oxygenase 2-like n=1 Tax=Nematolebias whitei TaxID=451745 RepID=UPI00189B6DA4|nr:heme oxygenase 2-like [Nematolebias whitei]
MSGSAIITDQIISVSTHRAPNTPPHPTITPSCYLLPSHSHVPLFNIDEINLEEIPRSFKTETVSLTSAAKVNTESKSNGATTQGARIMEDEDEHLSPFDLSEMLAEGTKEAHDRAENCQFVKDFLRGHIKKELFKRGTAALYFVYLAMEEEMEKNKDHPHVAPLYFPADLYRREALAQDLEYLYGDDWESQISLSAGTKLYVDRIHEVGLKDPVLLAAHSYTRYMGDLSGGQILKKVAQRALKLPSTGEGLNFYQFEEIHSHKDFKQLYRSRLNELELDMETKQRIVDESNKAFGFNVTVFSELEEIGKTIKEEVLDAGFGHGHAEIMQGGDISKCPYYAAKMAVSGNPTHAVQLVQTLLRQLPCTVVLATWVAILAGFTAWYFL